MTVKHGNSPDSIYTLGPIVFWASAEMTCGFFILCVPCIPKIIQEAGIIPAIKKGTGMLHSSGKSNHVSSGYARGGGTTKASVSANKDYYQLEEEGMNMKNLSESTEHLHHGSHALAITRTTRVTVVNDSRSVSDSDSKNDGWDR